MKVHDNGGLLVMAAAVLAALAVLAVGLAVAFGVRSVVAEPGSGPAASPPNPGHSWSQIGDLPGTMWHSNNDGPGSGLDADTVDGLQASQLGGAGYWTQAGSSLYANDAAWKVGIGTYSPQSLLSVGGTGSADVAVYGYGPRGVKGDGTEIGVLGSSATGTGVYGTSQGGTGVYGHTDTGLVSVWGSSTSAADGVRGSSYSGNGVHGDSNTGNGVFGSGDYGGYFLGRGYFSEQVGIGTETPSHMLTVASWNTDTLRLMTTVGLGEMAKLNFGDANYAYIQEDEDDKLSIYSRLRTAIMGGNVGIGTTTPEQKLHVAGIGRFDVGGGSVSLTTPGGWPGIIAYETGGHRRDIIFDSGGIRLLTSSSSSPPGAANGITINEDGSAALPVLRITGGSDIAEPFDIEETDAIEPGMVLTIDPENPGKLEISEKPYDRLVAGIVSGAGGIEPGLVMGQSASAADGEYAVALTGRVYVWTDASNGSISPGDLLTTSDTPGHAMKVTDHERAQGAILGKAMSSLEAGQGLVLALVTLQ